ncbi:MAG: hypothetical protein U1F76_20305 [Candidatus Competibacteraceae bacterium]
MSKRKTDRDGLFRRKDSPRWWARYTDAKGSRVRRSTGTDNRREAEAKLSHWKAEVHQERIWGREPERTLHQLMHIPKNAAWDGMVTARSTSIGYWGRTAF